MSPVCTTPNAQPPTPAFLTARPGLEPGSRDPKSPVLPLHHRASIRARRLAATFAATWRATVHIVGHSEDNPVANPDQPMVRAGSADRIDSAGLEEPGFWRRLADSFSGGGAVLGVGVDGEEGGPAAGEEGYARVERERVA